MEHVVQIGIGIDDEAIKERIVSKVSNEISDKLKVDVVQEITGSRYATAVEYRRMLGRIVDETIEKCMEQYKDEIIEKAVTALADKLSRTKAVKEKIQEKL